MINAKQAREQVTTNFLSTMSPGEKTIHFFIEAKVREEVEKGNYSVFLEYKDFRELWEQAVNVLSGVRLVSYYKELGYKTRLDTRLAKGFSISW